MVTRSTRVPEELWIQTHRGCRGRTKQWRKRTGFRLQRLMEKRRYKLCLPSLIMGNVRSLSNKMDELTALARSQREYWECSFMCFKET